MKKPVVKQRLLFRIMKITLFQLLLAFVFSTVTMANSVNGQKKLDTRVTLDLENLTLSNALSKLEKSAKVKFSYNSRISQLDQRVSYSANDESLATILANILKPLNIAYSEISNQIVLQNKAPQLDDKIAAFLPNNVTSGAFMVATVTGRVLDENGSPLPGATVMAKGTKVAVLTDMDGNFSINMPANTTVIVVTYIGMKTVEATVKATPMTITLNESGQTLNEVVITTGYEKTSKRTFTGAISRISEKDLLVEGVVDISRMIEGKAAGVTVQNVTGTFGTAPKITVRGSSSIFGDTKPL